MPASPQPGTQSPRCQPITMRTISHEKPETLRLIINRRPIEAACTPRTSLLDFVRQQAQLTGTHAGCEHGVCGACTVHMDGVAVRACLTLAHDAQGASITTVEGLSASGGLTDLQQAFSRHHALQCGFCTPGFLMVAEDLLRTIPQPTEEEIRIAVSANLCRCTGYVGIIQAIAEVARQRASDSAPQETPNA